MQPRKCITEEKYKIVSPKSGWVAYERCSFKRGSNHRDLAGIL